MEPTEAFTIEQLSALKSALEVLEHKLEEQFRNGISATNVVTLDQTSVGRVSRIDAMQQQKMAISTQRHIEVRLRKVKLALAAMANEEYGYCRQCDDPIQFKRLEIQPEANLCLHCQHKADQQ